MSGGTSPGALVAAVLLPPLGVYLGEGGIGRDFWIACGLTLLGWVPGILFALAALLLFPRTPTTA